MDTNTYSLFVRTWQYWPIRWLGPSSHRCPGFVRDIAVGADGKLPPDCPVAFGISSEQGLIPTEARYLHCNDSLMLVTLLWHPQISYGAYMLNCVHTECIPKNIHACTRLTVYDLLFYPYHSGLLGNEATLDDMGVYIAWINSELMI